MKKFNRILLRILLFICVSSAVLMLSLPSLLSSNWAKEEFLKTFNQKINGNLAIDRLQLGWFSSQQISGLELSDKNGEKILSVDQMLIPASLFKLLWAGSGDFEVKNLEAKIEWLTPSKTNLEEVLYNNQILERKPLAFLILNNVNALFSTQSKQAVINGEVSNGHESGQFKGNISLEPEPFIALDIHQLPVDILAPFSQKENLKKILGKTMDLTINQKMGLNHISEITAQATSPNLSAKISGSIKDSHFSLKQPAEILLHSTDELNKILFQDEFENIKYAFVTNQVHKILLKKLDFSFKNPHNLDLAAGIILPELNSLKRDAFHFKDVELLLSSAADFFPLAFQLTGEMLPVFSNQNLQTTQESLNGFTFRSSGHVEVETQALIIPYAVEFFSKNGQEAPILNFKGIWSSDAQRKKQFSAEGSANNFPLSYLRFWHETPLLPIFMGSSLTGNFNLNLEDVKERKGFLEFNATGTHWNSRGHLLFDKNIKIKTPIEIFYSFTPHLFQELQKKLLPQDLQVYALSQNTDISLHLKKGACSLAEVEESLQSKLEKSCMDITASTTPFIISNTLTGQSMSFSSFDAEIFSENFQKELQMLLNITEDNQQTYIKANGTLQNIFNNNNIDLKKASLVLNADIHQFSLPLFVRMLAPEHYDEIESLVGPHVNANLSVQIQDAEGPLQFSVNGTNGSFELFGSLKNGNILLTQPLQFQVKATPEFGKAILHDVLPLFSEVVSADHPLQITIDPQGFVFPLYPFYLRNFQIKKGTMTLGKITFKNSGTTKLLQNLFKMDAIQDISIWFTPLYFSVQKGNLKLERVDMQIGDEHPIAIWGDVNFIQDRVDLTLGLTAPALLKAFEIADLPQDYILQIPVTGTIDNASVDITKATGKITALIAKNQKNAQGKIVGTFLDILSGKLKERPVPPPTTNPLPWENKNPLMENPVVD